MSRNKKMSRGTEASQMTGFVLSAVLLVLGATVQAQTAPGQSVTASPVNHDCPIAAVKITPHVYMFRVYKTVCLKSSGGHCVETGRGEAWVRSNRMALDLAIRNVSNRDIASLTFHITDRHAGSAHDWDDVHVNLKPGEVTSVFYPNGNYSLIALDGWDGDSVMVELYGLRYGDGEMVNTSCGLGSALLPEPFQPVRANSDSPVYEGKPDSPPRVLESYELPQPEQKMPWQMTAAERRNWSAPISHTAVFSLVVGEDGLPRDIQLKSGSLGRGWDEKEIEVLRKWNFGPATKDGKPIALRISLSVDYVY